MQGPQDLYLCHILSSVINGNADPPTPAAVDGHEDGGLEEAHRRAAEEEPGTDPRLKAVMRRIRGAGLLHGAMDCRRPNAQAFDKVKSVEKGGRLSF